MKVAAKIIFLIGLGYILAGCICLLMLAVLPIEFKSYRLKEDFASYFLFGVPIAIAFTGARFAYKNLKGSEVLKRILGTLLLALVVFAVCFAWALMNFDMCATTTDKTLFVNKNDPSLKIVRRSFGCGATDSTPDIQTIARQQPFLFIFFRYTKTDTTRLDRSKWIAIDN